MAQEGSVAPRERVNIVYQADTGTAKHEKELPLKLMVMGDFTGRTDDTPLENRKPVSINRDNFDDVLASHRVSLSFSVDNRLGSTTDGELPVRIDVAAMKDFGPEAIARQVPELRRLLELREALTALKGPLGSIPAFRATLQDLVRNDEARAAILRELGHEPARA